MSSNNLHASVQHLRSAQQWAETRAKAEPLALGCSSPFPPCPVPSQAPPFQFPGYRLGPGPWRAAEAAPPPHRPGSRPALPPGPPVHSTLLTNRADSTRRTRPNTPPPTRGGLGRQGCAPVGEDSITLLTGLWARDPETCGLGALWPINHWCVSQACSEPSLLPEKRGRRRKGEVF